MMQGNVGGALDAAAQNIEHSRTVEGEARPIAEANAIAVMARIDRARGQIADAQQGFADAISILEAGGETYATDKARLEAERDAMQP